ncbi:MAG: PDR/VanB family oxidoreductase [Comamonadaceae bacterium]|nr:PDR/VanB family oxidoreductase [Comamonadaceae bacterium]
MSDVTPLMLRVAHTRQLSPLIRQLCLQAEDGSALPGYTPGAHIQVRVRLADGREDWRHYSLIELSGQEQAQQAPVSYTIAVRLEEAGRGGSRFMHEGLQEGSAVAVLPPRNDFPMHDGAPGAVLAAGGIGVTPLASMAAARQARGQPVRMVYAGRQRSHMAFLEELQALLGDALEVHVDDERGAALDAQALVASCTAGEHLYVCGPQVMLDAVLAAAQAQGMARERVHFELFAAPAAEAGDGAFEIVLAQSGQTLTVQAGQTILDCLLANGHDPMFDCQRGECGVCAVDVLEGEIDHRDYVLSQAEKDSGKVIQICISRAKGGRLVLDM